MNNMQNYLSPVGYDSTRVTRPVLSEGIDDGDRIILLRPRNESEDNRAAEAIDDIKRMIRQINPDVTVDICEITHNSFPVAVLECSDLITEIEDRLIVNFGGGPREVYLPVATAVLTHPDAVSKALQFSDLDGSVQEIPIPQITGSLPDQIIVTLNAIISQDGRIGIPELADQLDKSKSTVSRHIQELEKHDAVEAEMHGKTKTVQATFSGKLRARMARS